MKSGILPKIFAYAGSVSIDRTWRSAGKDVKRQVKNSDISNIGKAIDDGWVITFPQGTTTPFKPIRRGTAHIIKTYKPIVIPIVIDGFTQAWSLVAMVAFISMLCDRAFSATHYALLASLGNLGRTLLSSYSGVVIDDWLMGNWSLFFILTALMVLPSLIFLFLDRA